MAEKIGVALLFGGRSSEHSISCATARGVLQAIDRDRYQVIPIGITVDGAHVLENDDAEKFRLDGDQLPHVADNGSRIEWPESTRSRALHVRYPDGDRVALGDVDIVFPILHGPYGEDGTIQGFLELYDIPYVGAGVLASAAGMDKHFTKALLQHHNVPVAPWNMVTARQWADSPEVAYAALEDLELPVFVKPSRAGSSVGVSKVTAHDELADAMRTALAHDTKILIEKAVVGREVEIGVLDARDGGTPRTSVAGEIVVKGDGFYDFDAKYINPNRVELVCPASLTEDEGAAMASLAVRAFNAIDCRGLARVDFFLTDTGFVVNEVNTMPGFTPISMFPLMWRASGMNYSQLIDELINMGLNQRQTTK